MKPCYIQAYISAVTVDTITRMVKSTLFELFQITVEENRLFYLQYVNIGTFGQTTIILSCTIILSKERALTPTKMCPRRLSVRNLTRVFVIV